MSKPKHQLGIRTKKKMNKEVRASTHQSDLTIAVKTPKVKTLLPEETGPRPSKKATHDFISVKASPHITHIEGKKWIKTLEKQIQAKNLVQTRHSLKKNKGHK